MTRAPSVAPVELDIDEAHFDDLFSILLASTHPQLHNPGSTQHRVVVRSTTAYEVEFKVRSSNPAVLTCSPAAGVLGPGQSMALLVLIQVFQRRQDGMYAANHTLLQENPALKISATRIDHATDPLRARRSFRDINIQAAYDIILAPFQPQPLRLPVMPIADATTLAHESLAARGDDSSFSVMQRRTSAEEAAVVAPPALLQPQGSVVAQDTFARRNLRTPRKSVEMEVEPFDVSTEMLREGASRILQDGHDGSPTIAPPPPPAARIDEPSRPPPPPTTTLGQQRVESWLAGAPPPAPKDLVETSPGGESARLARDALVIGPPRDAWNQSAATHPSSGVVLAPSLRPVPLSTHKSSGSSSSRLVVAPPPPGTPPPHPLSSFPNDGDLDTSGAAITNIRSEASTRRVHVVVRARPLQSSRRSDAPTNSAVQLLDSNENASSWSYNRKSMGDADQTYFFDAVLGPTATTRELGLTCGLDQMMSDVARGISACILLYGQTNTGKTFTMFGQQPHHHPSPFLATSATQQSSKGLLHYALEHLFLHINPEAGDVVSLAFVEVYNEEIRDLLSDAALLEDGDSGDAVKLDAPVASSGFRPSGTAKPGPSVVYDPTSETFVLHGVLEAKVNGLRTAMNFLNGGLAHLTVSESHLNDRSSRAHTIFRVRVERFLDDATVKTHSELLFVDLAGSESVSTASTHSNAEAEAADILAATSLDDPSGDRLSKKRKSWVADFARVPSMHHLSRKSSSKRETMSINLSLSSLKKVILLLARGDRNGGTDADGGGGDGEGTGSRLQQQLLRRNSLRKSSTILPKGESSNAANFISYRGSTLTKILKQSLSGNSQVLMICTVALDAGNHKETKATLSFGTLAKSVHTAAVVAKRQAPSAGIIRKLEEENAVLKERLTELECAMLAEAPELSQRRNPSTGSGRLNSVPGGGGGGGAPHHRGDITQIMHVDVMLEAFQASEQKLRKLVDDTIRYLKGGCSAFLFERSRTDAIGMSHGQGTRNNNNSARTAPSSQTTTPRFRRFQSATSGLTGFAGTLPSPSSVREVNVRLKLPVARHGAEIVVTDGKKQSHVRLVDVARVVLGRSIPDLKTTAVLQGISADDPATPIPSLVLEARVSSVGGFGISKRVPSSSSTSNGTASVEPLLVLLLHNDRDLEAWVIALARYAAGVSVTTAASCTTVSVFDSVSHSAGRGGGTAVVSFGGGGSSGNAMMRKRSAGPLHSSSVYLSTEGSAAPRGPVASAFVTWDVNAMARKFAFLQRDRSEIDPRLSAAVEPLHEREVLLCKQQNIDVFDYRDTKQFILGAAHTVKAVSLYDVRVSCRVTLYQAFAVLRLLKDLGYITEQHLLVTVARNGAFGSH